MYENTRLPFSMLASLVTRLFEVSPSKAVKNKEEVPGKQKKLIFNEWVGKVCDELKKERCDDEEIGKVGEIVLKLLWPDESPDRLVYGLKEHSLIDKLSRHVYDISDQQLHILKNWTKPELSHGLKPLRAVHKDQRIVVPPCLGGHIWRILEHNKYTPRQAPLSLVDAYTLLVELASRCAWTQIAGQDVKTSDRSRRREQEILQDLFRPLSAAEAAVMTQILLKNTKPLLNRVHGNGSVALRQYNANSTAALTRDEAADIWRLVVYEKTGKWREHVRTPISVGKFVPIAKCRKGSGQLLHSLTAELSGLVRVERKYDGEFMQIHLDRANALHPVTIFSKSERNSTEARDRRCTHDTILKAVRSWVVDAVLLAEMVPYNTTEDCIGEFWEIRKFKPAFLDPSKKRKRQKDEDEDTQSTRSGQALERPPTSPISDKSEGDIQLAVVFFDILFVDGKDLSRLPWTDRREYLQSIIHPQHGQSLLAKGCTVDFDEPYCVMKQLIPYYAAQIAQKQEGIVLKPCDSGYNDSRWGRRWIKVKRDFIPGLGDTLDFAILGGKFNPERGAELGVGANILTTFYVGVLADRRNWPTDKPHFLILFTVEFFNILDARGALDMANDLVEPLKVPYPSNSMQLDYTFTLDSELSGPVNRPVYLFSSPQLWELMGAGFQRKSESHCYELRWPRVTKIHNETDRHWIDSAMTMSELERIGKNAMRRSHADEFMSRLFDGASPPSLQGSPKALRKDKEIWTQVLMQTEEGNRGKYAYNKQKRKMEWTDKDGNTVEGEKDSIASQSPASNYFTASNSTQRVVAGNALFSQCLFSNKATSCATATKLNPQNSSTIATGRQPSASKTPESLRRYARPLKPDQIMASMSQSLRRV
ncbi:hypothetical protein BT69DRAFT_1320634 [Atractiella rhizophila]|nr:hypothetical protein BT69DRAFT_1320634 [Atractiella rhizophila]